MRLGRLPRDGQRVALIKRTGTVSTDCGGTHPREQLLPVGSLSR
jgi:hypothetical protein